MTIPSSISSVEMQDSLLEDDVSHAKHDAYCMHCILHATRLLHVHMTEWAETVSVCVQGWRQGTVRKSHAA